ncbi:MAG TPA: hypothetical protein VMH81_25985 [Bryobacteraceae bacterium]|nr:hypothetical protein [Bryobacteraceae bacterium]
MIPNDTSPKAWEVYWKRLTEMSPAERIDIAVALWSAADDLQRAGTRWTYPDASEEEITFRIAITRFGLELARKVYRR